MNSHQIKKYMRLVLPLFVMLVLSVGAAVQAQDAEQTPEPEATPLVGPSVLSRVGDATAQLFTFEGVEGDNVRLMATSNDGLALMLLLSTAEGEFVAQARDVEGTGRVVLEAPLPATGEYFVTVLPVAGSPSLSEGTYALVLETNAFVAGVEAVEATPAVEPAVLLTPVPLVDEEVDVVEATPAVTLAIPSVVVTDLGMQVALNWDSTANLNLEVRDPVGNTLYFDNPVTEFGGTFSNDVNQNCVEPVTEGATEQATWTPGGIPVGSYEILVYFTEACATTGPVDFTVAVTIDGEVLEPVTGTFLPGQVYLASYELEADGSAAMREARGVRGDEQLPASAAVLIRDAEPLEIGATVTDTITNDDPFDSFAFDAAANQFVTITMNAISGSLDPYVALIDPTGNVVYFNDDAAEGVTDSALTNVLLALPGTYTVVASRYGQLIGGTEGAYELTVAGAAGTAVPGATDAVVAPVAGVPESVEALDLPEGNVEVVLVWNTNADLQLLVRDPAGESVYDDNPTIRSGGTQGAAGNVGCRDTTASPVSYIYWPENVTPRAGAYEIDVWFQNECNDPTPVSFNLYTIVNDVPVLSQTVTSGRPFLPGEHYVTSFTINQDGTVVAGEGGVIGVSTLDWESEAASAIPMVGGDVQNGAITPTNKFDLYAFEGLAGDVVTVAMNAAPGSVLDTKLYLIGPNGSVVAENDDAIAGENTDSLISNFTLPEDGQYIIIATHYGDRFGVTSGAYTLSLQQST